jgi:hypothetical protein
LGRCFIVLSFNVAVVNCAKMRLDGGDPTVADGFRASMQRLGRIAVWALISATVGLILRMIAERSAVLGKLVAWLVGAAWSIATYFIVPVMIFERRSVRDSIKQSTNLISKTWGESLAAGIGIGAFTMLLGAAGLLVPIAGAFISVTAALIGTLRFVGYLFGADPLYTLPRLTAIAWQTSSFILAVGFGLTACMTDRQPAKALFERSASGMLARRTLPFLVVTPIVLGLVRIYGQDAGLYDRAMGTATYALLLIVVLMRYFRRIPAYIAVLFAATVVAWLLHLPLETIGTRFGGIPSGLPHLRLPAVSFELMRSLISPAITVAMLGAIESLMSAVVADRMGGDKHNPNVELIGQGIANVITPFFGGLPATGASRRERAQARGAAALATPPREATRAAGSR